MKPDPRRSADISAVMMRVQQVELDESEMWVVEVQNKAVGKWKIGRPRKLRHPIKEAAATAMMSAPDFGNQFRA
jgi:predicted metal-dependent peptidase